LSFLSQNIEKDYFSIFVPQLS